MSLMIGPMETRSTLDTFMHHEHGRWQAKTGRGTCNKDLYLDTFTTGGRKKSCNFLWITRNRNCYSFHRWYTMAPASLYLGFAAAILWVGSTMLYLGRVSKYNDVIE